MDIICMQRKYSKIIYLQATALTLIPIFFGQPLDDRDIQLSIKIITKVIMKYNRC